MKLVVAAHVAVCGHGLRMSTPTPTPSLTSRVQDFGRRTFAASTAAGAALSMFPRYAKAGAILKTSKVIVAGATGQTGSRVYSQLRSGYPTVTTVAGVRDLAKASAAGITSCLKLDVNDPSSFGPCLEGADALVIAVGFVPGNPFKFNVDAHAVDNVGTCALIDAAKAAKLKKVILVSSILTDGRSWGQENSVGFKITNAFGGVLDEKIVAERHLRASGLDYTIVRPGGLKASPPSGQLIVSGENTLNSGEVSR